MLHISSNTAPEKIASGVIRNAKQQRETDAYEQTLRIFCWNGPQEKQISLRQELVV